MFDFSFGEMLLVGLVALVVLGPERLPKAARFIGLWVRRARAQWYSVKSELERELASEELRRSLADGQQVMRETEAQIRMTDANMRATVSETVAEVRAPVAEVGAGAIDTRVDHAAELSAGNSPGYAAGDRNDIEADDTAASARQDAHGP